MKFFITQLNDKMSDKEIIQELFQKYGEEILPVEKLPAFYCPGGISNVKAIYLGCDPSNKHSQNLPYVFAHESGLKIFNKFIIDHTEQLKQIDLSWNNVYAQNICRNYFKNETAKNPIWKNVAKEFWIEKLKAELAKFDLNVPVLLTSQILLQVLGLDGYEKILAPEFYECRVSIPIPANKNKLNRNLIILYRGKSRKFEVSYHLKNDKWNDYKNSITKYFGTVPMRAN